MRTDIDVVSKDNRIYLKIAKSIFEIHGLSKSKVLSIIQEIKNGDLNFDDKLYKKQIYELLRQNHGLEKSENTEHLLRAKNINISINTIENNIIGVCG
ncbi:hypothetical protein, partial [Staphylococcus lutrae]